MVKGYEQIPGVDFTESFAPTANDTTTGTLIAYHALYMRKNGWIVRAIDIETAFLEADLDPAERCYIEVLEGYELEHGKIDREVFVGLL